MVDGPYTSYNCFKWGREEVEVGRWWGDLTNVQYKPIWNSHNDSPLYNEYILIKKKKEGRKEN
jgi:hypothetical protein